MRDKEACWYMSHVVHVAERLRILNRCFCFRFPSVEDCLRDRAAIFEREREREKERGVVTESAACKSCLNTQGMHS